MSNMESVDEDEKFERWLDRQLTGDLVTGDLETDLRMAVSTIRGMPNIPKDFAVQPLLRFITHREERIKVEAELRAVNNNLNGWASYWSVNLGWEKFEQFMTNYKAELEQQLKTLDGQESTNGE